ncbi:MAG: BtrH N-terminal domain-containing protein [Paludibacteraceae bacterium]|nr:BtrH N-terminal domain-containing protein [Paludibacteraceae bacterium]
MIINYPHEKGFHCESATTRNLLKFRGYELNELLVFGISGGYDFIHPPFRLFCGGETPVFRSLPGLVFKKFAKRMKLDYYTSKYSNPEKSMLALDNYLNQGIPVGLVTEVTTLPYFPIKYEEFAGHSIVVFGKEGDEYLISDTEQSVKEFPARIFSEDLKKARWAGGLMSPKGKLFYIKSVPKELDVKKGILLGIKQVCYKMLDIPMPFFGVKGIYFFSKRLRKYEKLYGEKGAIHNLKVQLQISEEAGTGGSGFRFVYGMFLKEAATYFNNDTELIAIGDHMRLVGEKWQEFAVEALRYKEGRKKLDLNYLADIVYTIAQMEEKAFTDLRKWVKKQKA